MCLPVQLVVRNGMRSVFGMKTLSAVAAASIPVLLLVALIERLTLVFSSGLAKVICGERYMQPHDGIIGEHSCGFDADVYFIAVLIMLITASMLVLLFSIGHQKRFTR